MANLPHNPSKTDILENNWFEFLQFVKSKGGLREIYTSDNYTYADYEDAF
ncbi:MAG TPA: hypothetical protein VNG51_01075 [Ktedonobacteraceae bacterium]|nr:hypothetical protein [Ktedonobacteraceae bacterium]